MYDFVYEPRKDLKISFTAASQEDIFEQLSKLHDIFSEDECGKCKSHNLRFVRRVVGKFTFHELKCLDCGAIISFGKSDTGLYAKRYEMDGTSPKIVNGKKVYLADSGWLKWNEATKSKV
jgi:hypothetical protein